MGNICKKETQLNMKLWLIREVLEENLEAGLDLAEVLFIKGVLIVPYRKNWKIDGPVISLPIHRQKELKKLLIKYQEIYGKVCRRLVNKYYEVLKEETASV